jgi:hypothetical protein
MRMSHVLLAGVAIAGAVATTSAFTAGNTYTVDNNIAGYSQVTVSGATIINVAYNPVSSDATLLASVEFTANSDITDADAVMTLKQGATTPATGQANSCSVDGTTDKILCTLTTPMPFVDFDQLALTVVSQ